MSGLLNLMLVALGSLISLDRELVGCEDRIDTPVVVRTESSCRFVIRISMTMPFASTVVIKRRVIELFIICHRSSSTAFIYPPERHLPNRKLAPWRKEFAACAALRLRSILLTKIGSEFETKSIVNQLAIGGCSK
jgi:hypothetical protein